MRQWFRGLLRLWLVINVPLVAYCLYVAQHNDQLEKAFQADVDFWYRKTKDVQQPQQAAPDHHAEVLRLSDRTLLPPEIVERNFDLLKSQYDAEDNERSARDIQEEFQRVVRDRDECVRDRDNALRVIEIVPAVSLSAILAGLWIAKGFQTKPG